MKKRDSFVVISSEKSSDFTSQWDIVHRCLLILVVACVSGCGSSEYSFAPVAGRVTLDGEPVANARITFEPLADETRERPGPWSVAAADAQGNFTMNTAGGLGGAVVGRHRVRISTRVENEDGTSDLVPEMIPAMYNEESELIFEVKPGGDNSVHFPLLGID